MKGVLDKITFTTDLGYELTSHIIIDHRCDNCEYKFTPVSSPETDIQPSNALEIEFQPYYGGYFDQGGPQTKLEDRMYRNFWLCEACADKLIEQFPCFKVKR